jgi:phage terminase large subunit GpA-like protein
MTPWAQIVREFQSAIKKAKRGDTSELKTFVNTTLGETWEEEVEKADHEQLKQRAEPYALRTLPMGVLAVTAGIDVQDDRFEITAWGWGEGEESWTVDHVVLQANPASEASWDQLDAYLKTTYQHAGGQVLGIEAAAIDTGGHFTHQVARAAASDCSPCAASRLPESRSRAGRASRTSATAASWSSAACGCGTWAPTPPRICCSGG